MERTSLNYGGPVSRGILAWPAQHTSAKWTSVVICLPPVSHNGLSARELCVGPNPSAMGKSGCRPTGNQASVHRAP